MQWKKDIIWFPARNEQNLSFPIYLNLKESLNSTEYFNKNMAGVLSYLTDVSKISLYLFHCLFFKQIAIFVHRTLHGTCVVDISAMKGRLSVPSKTQVFQANECRARIDRKNTWNTCTIPNPIKRNATHSKIPYSVWQYVVCKLERT